MELTRLFHDVREVGMASGSSFDSGSLTIDPAAAEAIVLEAAPALSSARVSWASPGDSARIVKVLDAVEPRTKGPGGGGIFPGFLGPAGLQGRGETHILAGSAVVVAGYLPRAQEAVVDMTGPAAALSPLGSTHNLVVEFEPGADASWEAVDDGLRLGSLRLAAWLAELALGQDADRVETSPAGVPTDGALPVVGVVTNLQTQGVFKDVFVSGRSFMGADPLLVDPDEIDDGLVVSGQYGHPSLKNPTYVHQNHPIVAALRARHGVDVVLGGVVLCPEPVDSSGKEKISLAAAQLCRDAGMQGVIVTKEGGGNADADMALKMDAAEDLGLTAVGLFAEMAGVDGTGPPVVVPPERATAMISTGNYDQRLELPAMDRALGGTELALLSRPAGDALDLPAAVVYCSLSPLGWGRFTSAAPPGAPS